MRRSVSVLLSALLLAGALSGCRAGPPGPSSPSETEATELQPPLAQEDLELPVPDFHHTAGGVVAGMAAVIGQPSNGRESA